MITGNFPVDEEFTFNGSAENYVKISTVSSDQLSLSRVVVMDR